MRGSVSSFARGWPAIGLLLLRLVAGAILTLQGIETLYGGDGLRTVLALLMFGAASLLIAGLWTPIGGAATLLVQIPAALSHPVDIWRPILLATDGLALALVGPGAWSADARLFGWKRIEIGDSQE